MTRFRAFARFLYCGVFGLFLGVIYGSLVVRYGILKLTDR